MLATVNTIDKDIGVNANVTYKFAATDGGDGETSKFTIDPFTGDITLGKNSFQIYFIIRLLFCYNFSLDDCNVD